MILLNTPRTLKAFDGKPTEYGQITHIARIDCLSFDIVGVDKIIRIVLSSVGPMSPYIHEVLS